MKKILVLLLSGLLASLLAANGAVLAETKAARSAANAPAPWEQDWEQTLAAARKEGKVVALSSFGGQSNRIIAAALKDKLGLDIEFIVGRGPENITKVQNERRAGLFLEDIYLGGLSELTLFRDNGFLTPVRPVVVLPEALDPKAWMGGGIYIPDKEGLMIAYQSRVVGPIVVNSDMVKPEEIKSYRNLLDPKWKDKLLFYDPTKGGHGPISFMIFWEFMGHEFTRQLTAQNLVFTGDSRQQTEWVARGKYPITGVMASDMQNEFVKAGAHLKTIVPAEGTFISASKGALAVLKNAAHPNATKALINWILTKEGQTVMSNASGDASRRLDVTKEYVADPALVPQPGVIYRPSDSDEMIRERIRLQKVSAEVWNIK